MFAEEPAKRVASARGQAGLDRLQAVDQSELKTTKLTFAHAESFPRHRLVCEPKPRGLKPWMSSPLAAIIVVQLITTCTHQAQYLTAEVAAVAVEESPAAQYVASWNRSTRVEAAAAAELRSSGNIASPLDLDDAEDDKLARASIEAQEAGGVDEEEGRRRETGGAKQNLIEFLESLPISSVGQKHTGQFECDLSARGQADSSSPKLVWLKLVQPTGRAINATAGAPANDITPLSLDKRMLTLDKRFKVHHQPPARWLLTIENVSLADDKAYFVCQVGGRAGSSPSIAGSGNHLNFAGGARLNVLVPPKIVDAATSPNLVLADEFSALKLQCEVTSEQQSQISWRREDGQSLEGLELRFKHRLERRPHQLLSVDSSELLFGSVRREQAGAFLCIASNGVQPGVSQRISLVVVNCRESPGGPASKPEPCDLSQDEGSATETRTSVQGAEPSGPSTETAVTTTSTSTTTRRPAQQMGATVGVRPTKRTWASSTGGSRGAAANTTTMDTRRRQQQGDKSRTMRYNVGSGGGGGGTKQGKMISIKREGDNESSGARSSLASVGVNQISCSLALLLLLLVVRALICGAPRPH